MIDFDECEAAGIANARDHAPLIEYLDGLGFALDEMVEAEREGRLYALAGDALIRSGRSKFSLRMAADTIGVELEDVEHAWASLGLTVAGPDDVALSEADVNGLATWAMTKAIFGDDAAFGLLRVLGSSLARIADAQGSAFRLVVPEARITYTGDELATARAFRSITEFIPATAALIDAVYRRHLISARLHYEAVVDESSTTVVCGVGFVDLTGFTSLTQQLTQSELSTLLSQFTATVTDVVHADGGRVVKFIGDAVMWVSATAELLARTAADLVDHPHLRANGMQVRAGLAFGSVLDLNGDYFGHAVNLAARMVDAATAGEILASTAVREAVPEWSAVAREALNLKGIDEPVTAYILRP